MSSSDAKLSDQTITLDTSNETDVIDCSIEEIYNKNDFLKTPRSHLKRKCASTKKNEVISLKGFQFKNDIQQVNIPEVQKNDNSVRRRLRSSFKSNDSVISDDSIIASSTPDTSKRNENKDDAILHNLLPGLKNSPYLPYLCKSKLNRIGNWLNENDIETATTPPCSNNKRSSLRLKKISSTQCLKSQSKEDDSPDSSSIDSEVEKVLVAVYGKDWKAKNVLKKSKTEPKKSRNQICGSKTDLSNKATTEVKSVRTAKRNILKAGVRRGLIHEENLDNLDSPCSLGVKKLNESESTDDNFSGKNLSSVKRPRLLAPCSTSSRKTKRTPKQSTVNNKKTDVVEKRITRSRSNPMSAAMCSVDGDSEQSNSNNKTPTKTFLASLSLSTPRRKSDPEAQDFKINFKSKKEELTRKLFNLYNSEIFGNGLPDDLKVAWNAKMRRTAGYCCNKKILKSSGQTIRLSRVELSAKIVDRADRLRDTLIHELCHAASWIIDGKLDGHGSVWAKWSRRAMEKFPELPPIKRCHNYEIAAKYTYKCSGCGYSINRCSKSINTERKRCGFCFGVLQLFLNKKKRGKREAPEYDLTRTISVPNTFALFVKNNYDNVKTAKRSANHAEIMRILSEKYALMKETVQKYEEKMNSTH